MTSKIIRYNFRSNTILRALCLALNLACIALSIFIIYFVMTTGL